MHLSASLALVATLLASSGSAGSVKSLFGPHLSSGAEIYEPSDGNWTSDVQQRWSTWYAPTYRGAIKIATVRDIQNTVKAAVKHDLPFLATAAGHGTSETFYRLKRGINIDISRLTYAKADPKRKLVTIGGAAKFQQVWDELQKYKLELPTGAAQCVGSIGATLGAGIGPLQGQRGLMIDSLRSVTLVTANGSLVTASETAHKDLFWAMRGAGHNFGIVTEATYQAYDASYGGMVMESDLAFPGAINGSFWKVLKSFDEHMDPKLSLVTSVAYDKASGTPVIVLNSNYFGSNETLNKYLKPFMDLKPVKTAFSLVPWNKLYTKLFFGEDASSCQSNLHLSSAGAAVKQTNVENFIEWFEYYDRFSRKHPEVAGVFVVSRFPNEVVLKTPTDKMAYQYRDINTHLYWEHIFPDTKRLNDAVYKFVVKSRETFQPGSGYQNLTLYNNYNLGDEGPVVLYSPEKLERLSQLKSRWDPEERFSFYMPIPLNYRS